MFKVKKLTSTAIIPKRNCPTDAGADLFSDETCIIKSGEWRAVSTGISISLPEGSYGRIAPRSGLALKNGIDVLGGVVDSGYRGEIKVILFNHSDINKLINAGDKIAQLIIEQCLILDAIEVDSLESSDRGEKGFGSSGQ